jgi:hypothetical protein
VPLTYVDAEELSLPAILDGVRAGRTFVSSGPDLQMRAVTADGREWPLGSTVPGEARIEARCARSPRAQLRLASGGAVTAREDVTGSGRVSAPAANAAWHVAELWDGEGKTMLAITSPIYVG